LDASKNSNTAMVNVMIPEQRACERFAVAKGWTAATLDVKGSKHQLQLLDHSSSGVGANCKRDLTFIVGQCTTLVYATIYRCETRIVYARPDTQGFRIGLHRLVPDCGPPYRIEYSETADWQLAAIRRRAAVADHADLVEAALDDILSYLHLTPNTGGEEKYLVRERDEVMRTIIKAGIVVHYTVNQRAPKVLVKRILLIPPFDF